MKQFEKGDRVVVSESSDDEEYIGWAGVVLYIQRNTLRVRMDKKLLGIDTNENIHTNERDFYPYELEPCKTTIIRDIIKDL